LWRHALQLRHARFDFLRLDRLSGLIENVVSAPRLHRHGCGGIFKGIRQSVTKRGLSGPKRKTLKLRLESRKGPLDVIVVDRAEKASKN
jgi:hypothetical protein